MARNLYLDFAIEESTRAQLEQWNETIEAEPSDRPFRWHMRADNYLRHVAIGASTRIEGNPLSLSQADELLAGGSVEGPEDAIREIRNYRDAQDLASTFARDPDFEWSQMIPRTLQARILRDLEGDSQGAYRAEPVGVADVYTAPDHQSVAGLMRRLVSWIQATDEHPLVRTALLHLNVVAIHPWIDGNGRSARVLSSLELMRIVRSPELISIETAILDQVQTYFERIRQALGPRYQPERHSATEWVAWYVDLHAQRLEFSKRLAAAVRYDIGTVIAALESSRDPAEWGPIIELASFGAPLTTRTVADVLEVGLPSARRTLSRLVDAGWLERHGQTSGQHYVATEKLTSLQLRAPEIVGLR